MKRCVIGIDPGLKGGIAWIDDSGATSMQMPLVDGVVSLWGVLDALRSNYTKVCAGLVVIEALGMRPGQSGVATMVRNWQRLEDACIFARVPYQIVQPKTWQKGIVPAGLPKSDRRKLTIDAYCRYARAKWPHIFTKKSTHDGMAAALCMAEWGVRQLTTPA